MSCIYHFMYKERQIYKCQVWCFIVSTPDLCLLSYFVSEIKYISFINQFKKIMLSLNWIKNTNLYVI